MSSLTARASATSLGLPFRTIFTVWWSGVRDWTHHSRTSAPDPYSDHGNERPELPGIGSEAILALGGELLEASLVSQRAQIRVVPRPSLLPLTRAPRGVVDGELQLEEGERP